jgi:hypothetical protein
MYQLKQATQSFQASCGNRVKAGEKFLFEGESRKSYCAFCGVQHLGQQLGMCYEVLQAEAERQREKYFREEG